MDAALMLSLMERLTALTAPSRMHPAVALIGERAEAWGRAQGLISGEPGSTPLGRAAFERLSARLLPDAPDDRVTLFTQWLIWMFALDDTVDEGPLGGSATAVDSLYAGLLNAVRRGHARPEARPLEVSLVALWGETAPLMTPSRRRHFMGSFQEHRTACAEEAVNRRTGQTPAVDQYPALRRRAAAPFLLDLAEPMLGVELPHEIVGTHCWQSLVQGTFDLIAWSNDVASYRKENARGDVHNYLTVVGAAYGLRPSQAIGWLNDEISLRATHARSAALALPGELQRLGLDEAGRHAVTVYAEHLLGAPRAHLDWLLESGRYQDASRYRPAASPRPDEDLPAGPASAPATPAGGEPPIRLSGLNGWHDEDARSSG